MKPINCAGDPRAGDRSAVPCRAMRCGLRITIHVLVRIVGWTLRLYCAYNQMEKCLIISPSSQRKNTVNLAEQPTQSTVVNPINPSKPKPHTRYSTRSPSSAVASGPSIRPIATPISVTPSPKRVRSTALATSIESYVVIDVPPPSHGVHQTFSCRPPSTLNQQISAVAPSLQATLRPGYGGPGAFRLRHPRRPSPAACTT